MLALAFFTQGILSAHACVSADASAAHAVTSAVHEVQALQARLDETGADEMPCHHANKLNANECLTHCTQSDQFFQDHVQLSALPVSVAVLQVALPPVHDSKKTNIPLQHLALDSGPPLSILYCTFRI